MLFKLKEKHPSGLYLLSFIEMWERFSYYGMRSLLVLYMIKELMMPEQQAGNIYGLYTGFVYLTPLIGGYIADRYSGQRNCIFTGMILMSLGLFMLAFGGTDLFFCSLFFMICANGCFKSNISSVCGLLYENDNVRKDEGFTVFYMGINVGAFLSPLVCGTLAVKYGFKYGFAAAGTGMLIGLLTYIIFGKKLLGTCGTKPIKTDKTAVENTENRSGVKLRYLFLLMAFTVPFWICFEQAGSSLTLFAEYETNRNIFGRTIPSEFFQSLNPLFIITLAPLISMLWGYLREKSKEPSSPEKFAIAFFLMTITFLIMSLAGYYAEKGNVSALWLTVVYFLMTLSELCLSPIGLSLVSKLAPKKFLSLIMGCWFLASFFGNLIAGVWGGTYKANTPGNLFPYFALLSFLTFISILIFIPKLNKLTE